jgi:tetratricopeptide (TPR) repeat protein
MREKLHPQARYPDGHPDLALSLNNRAFLYELQGHFARAEPLYVRALARYQRLLLSQTEVLGEGDIHSLLASTPLYRDVYLANGRRLSSQADAHLLRQSLTILQEIEDKAEECRALAGLGEALLGDDQLREAAAYLEQGLQLSRKLHHKWLECRILCGLTEVAVAKGEQKTAANLRQQAIELAQEMGAKALEAKARSIQIR